MSGSDAIINLLAVAEAAIEEAQYGYGATLDLDEVAHEAESGSDVWDLADTMRVYVEEIETARDALDEAVADAEAELQSYRRKFGGALAR